MADVTEYVILKQTSEYRGDHSADLQIAYPVVVGETIEQLIQRTALTPTEVIQVRVMKNRQST